MTFTIPPQFFERRRVLVTGGAGFIGSHLARRLVELGAETRIIDDLSGGRWENLGDAAARITRIESSILDNAGLREAMTGCEIVFHEAALASVPASIEHPERYHDVNVTGTLRILEAARALGVRRVVFASSSSVYGDQPELPKRETQLPDPISPYAQQKLTGEYMLRVWASAYGLETMSLRYFNIFGPGQSADSAYAAVVAAFAKALLSGSPPTIFGDGGATRDFTYVDNVVDANLRAACVGWDGASSLTAAPAKASEFLRGGVVNIACGAQVSVLELAREMTGASGVDVTPVFAPPRAGDVRDSVADVGRARQWLGYTPSVGLAAGLRETLAWYRTALTSR